MPQRHIQIVEDPDSSSFPSPGLWNTRSHSLTHSVAHWKSSS